MQSNTLKKYVELASATIEDLEGELALTIRRSRKRKLDYLDVKAVSEVIEDFRIKAKAAGQAVRIARATSKTRMFGVYNVMVVADLKAAEAHFLVRVVMLRTAVKTYHRLFNLYIGQCARTSRRYRCGG